MGYAICGNKGFHITFKNDVTVSIQFGSGNYCNNYNDEFELSLKEGKKCNNAEVAIFRKSGKWITKQHPGFKYDVMGHVYPDELLRVLDWASKRRKVN